MSSRVDMNDPNERRFWAEGSAERRGDRLELAREAGWGRVSWRSVAAGVLTTIGTVALCVGVVAAVLSPLDLTTDTLTNDEWTRLGLVAGMAAAAVLLASCALGGYTAGRMARRSGARHGVLVFAVGVATIAAAIGIAQLEGALGAIRDRLDDLGAPTGDSSWGGLALLTIGVALAGALAGSLLGGLRGERWHHRLIARALDPDVGPEADMRADVEAQRRAAAKALERARKAGIVAVEESTESVTVSQERPTAVTTGADAEDEDDREAEPASTGVRRWTAPSSRS